MAVRINLLPDIHLAKLKAKHYRQLAVATATIICSVSLGIVLLLFIAAQAQNIQISHLKSAITEKRTTWSKTPDLQKILTTQQNLAFGAQLYKERAYMTKFFSLLGSVSPKDVALQNLDLDAQNSLKLIGRSRNFAAAAKFARALEASNITIGSGSGPNNTPNFTNIELGTLSSSIDGKVDFSLSTVLTPEVIRGE